MNFQLTHTAPTQSPKHSKRQYLHAGLGALVAVAVVAGAGAWMATHAAHPTTRAGAGTQAVSTPQPAPALAVPPVPVYLVNSQAQADQVQNNLAEDASYFGPAGMGDALKATIAVVDSPEQEAGVRATAGATANTYVVDLRTP